MGMFGDGVPISPFILYFLKLNFLGNSQNLNSSFSKSCFSAISKMSMIVEGYYATKNAYEISKSKNMNFEIIKVVHEILYNNKNAELELKLLAEKLN